MSKEEGYHRLAAFFSDRETAAANSVTRKDWKTVKIAETVIAVCERRKDNNHPRTESPEYKYNGYVTLLKRKRAQDFQNYPFWDNELLKALSRHKFEKRREIQIEKYEL